MFYFQRPHVLARATVLSLQLSVVSAVVMANVPDAVPPVTQAAHGTPTVAQPRPPAATPYASYLSSYPPQPFAPLAYDIPAHVSALQNLHLAVGSLHAVIELLTANAEAMQRMWGGLVATVDRVGQAGGEALGLFKPSYALHGADATLSPPAVVEQRAARRRQAARLVIGVVALVVAMRALRTLLLPRPGSAGGHRGVSFIPRAAIQLAAFAIGCVGGHALAASRAARLNADMAAASSDDLPTPGQRSITAPIVLDALTPEGSTPDQGGAPWSRPATR